MTFSFIFVPFTELFPSIIDFKVLIFISLIPLSLGILGLIKMPLDRKLATKYATYNIKSIFLVAILINSYFTYLILLNTF